MQGQPEVWISLLKSIFCVLVLLCGWLLAKKKILTSSSNREVKSGIQILNKTSLTKGLDLIKCRVDGIDYLLAAGSDQVSCLNRKDLDKKFKTESCKNGIKEGKQWISTIPSGSLPYLD